MNIDALNKLSEGDAYAAFEQCCTADKWVNNMVQSRPFNSENDLFQKADFFWKQCSKKDWIQACEGHPKIGDVSSLKKKYAATQQMAGHEQSGMNEADDVVIEALAEGNKQYENKFGYIFIVCATGKSAKEMLAILESRMPNDEEEELKIAMEEQRKITAIRLKKLLELNQ